MRRDSIMAVTEQESRVYQHIISAKPTGDRNAPRAALDPRLKCLKMLDNEEIIQSGGIVNMLRPDVVSFQPLSSSSPGK